MPYNPFGVRGLNNLTFARSYNNPDSNLSRMVAYLAVSPAGASKREILTHVFNRPNVNRGWSSGFFSLAQKAGFISRRRVGRSSVYTVGPRVSASRPVLVP